MAGRARRHALVELLEQLTRYAFEDEPTKTHLDYVCERVECGTTTKALCLELSNTLSLEITYARLMAYLAEQFGRDTTEQAIASARVRASHFYAEEGLELVDAQADTQVDVSRSVARAKQRNWLAERYNAAQYGQSKGVNVSISVGTLHLDALRAQGTRVTGAVATAQITAPQESANSQVVEAEIVSEHGANNVQNVNLGQATRS